jgi:hypothetical protein
MTLNEMKENLIKLGAVQRLSDLNKERNMLLKLLGKEDDAKASNLLAGIKAGKKQNKKGYSYKGKHWTQTPAGKKKITARLKAMWLKKKGISK